MAFPTAFCAARLLSGSRQNAGRPIRMALSRGVINRTVVPSAWHHVNAATRARERGGQSPSARAAPMWLVATVLAHRVLHTP